jgi:hypothetical protein
LKRKNGKPKPWTDDEILQQYFFTNPYRENDRVTVWFRENIREPLRDDPRVILATIIFRWFNLPETGEILLGGPGKTRKGANLIPKSNWGFFDQWNRKSVIKRLAYERDAGHKVFTGAFMINSPPGKPKLEAICDRIENVWRDRLVIEGFFVEEAYGKLTLQEAHSFLNQYDGLGGFMAYEIVCDLRYTKWLENAPDKDTWCNPGPGCRRGMYRVMDRADVLEGRGNASSPPKLPGMMKEMRNLLSTVRRRLPNMQFEMREIEHSLCEFDKYERARLRDGKLKRKYNGC